MQWRSRLPKPPPVLAKPGMERAAATSFPAPSTTCLFTNNVIVYDSRRLASEGDPYPKTPHCGVLKNCSQFFPKNWKAVSLANFQDGNGGNYHLLTTSPYHQAASDGKGVGADMDALDRAVAGVAP